MPDKTGIDRHQREDETIFIRMGSGIAAHGDRQIPVTAGAIIYVPQGVWHGLRNSGQALRLTTLYGLQSTARGLIRAGEDRLAAPP